VRRPPDYIVRLRADRARQERIAAWLRGAEVALTWALERYDEAWLDARRAYLRRWP
jgi:hypothetical protein